jgi:plasmid rolling circle replication initiator protein Rep
MMGGYIEPLRKLGDLHFTTLTRKNVTAEELPETINKMLKDMSNIIRVLREKRNIKLSGIRKIEVTYNSKTNTYHPHFHILHNYDVGNMIIDEWVIRNPNTAKKQGWDFKQKKMVNIQVTKPVFKKDEDDKKFLNEFSDVQIEEVSRLTVNSKVRIKQGLLMNYNGVLVEINGSRAKVRIETMGVQLSANFDKKNLEPVV